MSKILFRCISITIFVISCKLVTVAHAQETLKESAPVNVLDSVICEKPRRCLPHYQCSEDGTYNKHGALVINERFGEDDKVRDGDEVYDLSPNNTIMFQNGSIAKICHYLERCCGNDPTMPANKETPIANNTDTKKGCGYRNPDGISFKINTENDSLAQYGEFPWVVAIIWNHPVENGSKLAGGGSLIHPNVVVTAAHIVFDKSSGDIKMRAGEWDTQTELEILPFQERRVKQIITHENFQKTNLINDIALLIVAKPFKLAASIQPICIPTNNLEFDNGPDCYGAAWGKQVFLNETRRQSIMKKIQLPVVAFGSCEEKLRSTRLGSIYQLHESFICAGGTEEPDACIGDGGTALVCPVDNEQNRYYQTGIVSWGVGCGGNNIPTVFTNVGLMRNWIDDKMIQGAFGTDSYTVK